MSLVFNEAALNFLLESPEGIMGQKLRFVSEKIEANYNVAVDEVWQMQPVSARPQVGSDVNVGQFGLQAEIGLLDTHGRTRQDKNGKERPTTAAYMAHKFSVLETDKFVPIIMAGWDDSL